MVACGEPGGSHEDPSRSKCNSVCVGKLLMLAVCVNLATVPPSEYIDLIYSSACDVTISHGDL